MNEKPKNFVESSAERIAEIIERRVGNFKTNERQIIYPMQTAEGQDIIIRRAPNRWTRRTSGGSLVQVVGQVVVLMRDNYGEIFTLWSNKEITCEEAHDADLPAIPLNPVAAPPDRLEFVRKILEAIDRKY